MTSDSPAPTLAPEELLPLPTAFFHILVALAEENRHGYAIMQDIAERTGGRLRMSASTLYGAIGRLLERGLIFRIARRPMSPAARLFCRRGIGLSRVREGAFR